MFENPRRGRQARNCTTNVPKILDLKPSSEQIFSENCRWVPLMYEFVSLSWLDVFIHKPITIKPQEVFHCYYWLISFKELYLPRSHLVIRSLLILFWSVLKWESLIKVISKKLPLKSRWKFFWTVDFLFLACISSLSHTDEASLCMSLAYYPYWMIPFSGNELTASHGLCDNIVFTR